MLPYTDSAIWDEMKLGSTLLLLGEYMYEPPVCQPINISDPLPVCGIQLKLHGIL